jgi:hypothetical protein
VLSTYLSVFTIRNSLCYYFHSGIPAGMIGLNMPWENPFGKINEKVSEKKNAL